jgi:hypothetical protein
MIAPVTLTAAEQDAALAQVFAGRRGGVAAEEAEPVSALPFFGPVFIRAETAAPEPEADDLPAWLAEYEFRDENDLLQEVVNLAEQERDSLWKQADLCALALAKAPGRKARGLVAGRLAEHLATSKKTIRRRAQLGMTFPPDTRVPDRAVNLYLAALTAADPVQAIEAALAYGWSVAQLKEHIQGVENPLEKRELLDETYEGGAPDMEQVLELVQAVLADARGLDGLVSLRVVIRAEVLNKEAAA